MLKKLIFFALLGSMAAQVKVTPLPPPKTCLESAGTILSGGSVSTFAAGTTTPLASYTDSTGTVSNANPVVLDAAGCANIWLGPSSYKIVVKRSDGTTVYTTDGINGAFLNFLSVNGSNALTAISDPAVSLGLFWLSTNNAGRIKWSDASAVHTVVGNDTTDTLTNKTLASPAVTGNMTYASTTPVANLTVQNHPKVISCAGTNPCGALAQVSAFSLYDGGADYILSGGTLTITGLPFTLSNTYSCIAVDVTTGGNKVVASNNSGASVTFTGTGTDHFRFHCDGD